MVRAWKFLANSSILTLLLRVIAVKKLPNVADRDEVGDNGGNRFHKNAEQTETSEYTGGLRGIGSSLYAEIFEVADLNKDGKVDQQEAETFVMLDDSEIAPDTVFVDDLQDAFDQFDVDRDGKLAQAEFSNLLEAHSEELSFQQEEGEEGEDEEDDGIHEYVEAHEGDNHADEDDGVDEGTEDDGLRGDVTGGMRGDEYTGHDRLDEYAQEDYGYDADYVTGA
eukprot:TRINITY_DN2558_c0_g1_i2.p1 TRINITY_DN2558_c0_g1~~TRINITY_DN2558_c0_g1_i2.p1  ORF type:complete len:223 (+),score=53.46 TRINITY_DN2558_c0_g1_i2:50-718(+)